MKFPVTADQHRFFFFRFTAVHSAVCRLLSWT